MFELESFLKKERTKYKKHRAEFKAITMIISELNQQKTLSEIMDDENNSLKKNLPTHLFHQLELMTLSNKRMIEDTFIAMDSSKETAYLRELSRRLFYDETMEAAFAEVRENIKLDVKLAATKFLKENYLRLKAATEHYLKESQSRPDQSQAGAARKRTMEIVQRRLEERKPEGQDNLIYYRNRINSALTFLNTKENGTTPAERIKQDRHPLTQAFLATVAAVSSLLMVGIIPTIAAMIYSKSHYDTIKFWKASQGQLLNKSIKATQKDLGVDIAPRR